MKKYDMHIHTNYSKCSGIKPAKLLKIAKKRGLNGIAVTDHNTIKGALETKRLNKDKDFKVIIGSEIKTTSGGEILGYYLKKDVKKGTPSEVIDSIHKQGGLAFVAHPFGWGVLRKSMKADWKELKKVDGFETFNARMMWRWENELAVQFAQDKKIAQVGGSDAHCYYEIGRAFTVCEGDLKKALKQKKTYIAGRIAPLPVGRGISLLRKVYKRVL